ncbi:phospholipase D family protein [Phaeobacter sp. HF9A]|uniref:phospholipase D family protein n=1 Tax=Phaeobacter sp. HF9A TaxID=2721561 RepID=UPI00142F914E|nr:phospholipase D family protein [Phaeobacter sp. HF9A]NIZ12092.1 phosphatidylserine synthase [Phaeobacter sp. HF9A]
MPSDFTVLVTAEEAFPAFERAVLAARSHLTAGFRIFDMDTRLRSQEAQEIGETWFDLLAHLITKGIRIDLTVSDFDPDMAADLHAMSKKTVEQGAALARATGADASQLRVRMHLHPAQAGLLPRILLAPAVFHRRRNDPALKDRPSFSLPPLHPASHHQKVAVVDDETLYIGGLDLNDRRYDTCDHTLPAHMSWSDVQVLLRGPAAREAREHLESLDEVTAGRQAPSRAPHLLRTLSAPRRLQLPFLSPRILLSEIEQAHLTAFRQARHMIHIETQFLRSSRIAEGLAEAATRNADLRAVIVLPGTPQELAYEEHKGLDVRFGIARARSALKTVRHGFGARLLVAAPVRPVMAARETRATLAGSPLIHVHNKVLLVDDSYVLIGSANLNGRSMRWDTELAVESRDPVTLAAARRKLLQHWWFDPLPSEAMDCQQSFDWWKREISLNGSRLPKNRTGYLVPFAVDRNTDVEQDLPGVTENIV